MKRWADVSGGIVSAVVDQDSMPTINGVWVDITGQNVGPGWLYNDGIFSPPPAAEPIITKLSFRYRLTDAEYVGILSAAKTDVEVAAWIETFNMVTQINLDDPRTKSGLNMMVSKNLLTAERETEILTAPVQADERP